jgi:hypothetical protein
MGTEISSEREKIYVEDVAGGVSNSEAVGAKLGASINFIMDRIVQKLQFGIGGKVYSGLTTPYTASGNSELVTENYLIQRVTVSNQISGTAGTTEFKIERRPSGSATWTSLFSVNGSIGHAAADNLIFKSDAAAPANVTLPVLSITQLDEGDEVRFVLVSAASSAQNLLVTLEVSPI